MSRFVDERVVEMSFDNKRFESNVKTSMNTINDLKNSLDFSGTANKINGELGGINTSGLSGAILSAKNSFTTFEIAAIAAIANITNRIIDLGIQMVQSLSTDQIAAGWSKFAESSISEFTLLAQGFDQESITSILEKLAWYSDETSYSFTDMVDNMSKFTATGQGLEESSQAMIGIANWAALAGQNSSTASRAMYQLSQAMGAGYIRLMDWKSIQNANMDTREFRETALATAVAMGQLTQNIDGTYTTLTGKSFSIDQFTTELDELWFTSDVLMSTLEKYSSGADKLYENILQDDSINTAAEAIDKYGDDLDDFELKAFLAAQEARTFKDAIVAVKDAVSSGWMNVFKNIFGQVAEAKVLWSDLAGELYDVFMDGMWTKIDILGIWADNAGRDDLWAHTEENTGAFWNLFDAIVAIKDLIGGAWSKVFGFSDLEDYDARINDIATKLKNLTSNLKEWTSGLFLSSEATSSLTNIFTGLFSILKMIGKTVIAIFKGFYPVFDVLKSLAVYVLGMLGILGKKVTDFSEKTTVFEAITKNLQAFFNTIIDFVKSLHLVDGITKFINTFKESLSETVGETGKSIKPLNVLYAIVYGIAKAFKWLGNLLNTYVVPILPKLFDSLARGLGWVVGKIVLFVVKIKELGTAFIEWAKNNEKFQNGLNFLKKAFVSIGSAFKKVTEFIRNFFLSFSKKNTEDIDNYPNQVVEKLTPLQTFVKGLADLFSGLWSVIKAIVPVVGALFALIGKALTWVGDKLKAIFMTGNGDLNLARIFTVGFWAVVAVGIVRFAEMLRSVTQVFRDAFDSMFDFLNSKAMLQYMEAIKTMAVSILMMVGALLILGAMDTAVLTKSMIALSALVGFLVGVMLIMKKMAMVQIKGSIKDMIITRSNLAELGTAFIGIGAAVLILAFALKTISSINPEKMIYSLGILAIMLGMMVAVMKLVGESEKGTNKAVKSMVKAAISIALLARPLKTIGSIDTTTGIKGLIGIAAIMAIMVGFSRFSKAIDQSQRPIIGMMNIAIALNLMLIPLKVIGSMKIGHIATALGTITVIFGLIIGINKLLEKKLTKARMENLTRMMWSLIPMAIGLTAVGLALSTIGGLPWTNILIGLGETLAVFGMLIGLNLLLDKKLTKARIKNMTSMMWSLVVMSIGLTAFGSAISLIGSIPWKNILFGLGTIVAVLGIVFTMTKLMTSAGVSGLTLLSLSGSIVILAGGLLIFSVALLALGSLPLATIGKGLLAIVAVFVILGIAGLVLQPLIPILIALAATFAVFAVGVFLLVVSLTMLASIATVGAAVFAAGLMAIAGAIVIAAPLIMKALLALIEGVIDIFIKVTPKIVEALKTLILELLKGINEVFPVLLDTVGNLLVGIVTKIAEIFPTIIESLIGMLQELLKAIVNIFPEVTATLMTMLLTLLDTLIENIPELVNKLVDLFLGLIRGLTARLPEIMIELTNYMTALVNGAVNAVITMIPVMVNAGFNLIIGLLDGLGTAIVERAPELRQAIITFCENIWQAILSFFGINSPSTKMMEVAKNLIAGLLKGLWDGLSGLTTNIGKWAGDIMKSIGGFFEDAWQKGKDLVNNIKNGANNVWSATKTWFSNRADDISGFFSGIGSSIKTAGENIFNKLKEGAKNIWEKTSGVRDWLKARASDIVGYFSEKVNNVKTAGGQLIAGLKEGLETGGENIREAVETVAGNVVDWFKNIFGIKSPSRVFAEMGMYLDLGLAKGIDDHSDKAADAAEGLADDTADGFEKAGLSKVLSDLNSSLESDFDGEVVLRPVLDLSEIQNGKDQLYSMMDDMESYSITGSNNLAKRTRDEINSKQTVTKDSKVANANDENAPVEVMNNTFNITGSDPKAIADEVSRVLQIQIDRRKAKWAT